MRQLAIVPLPGRGLPQLCCQPVPEHSGLRSAAHNLIPWRCLSSALLAVLSQKVDLVCSSPSAHFRLRMPTSCTQRSLGLARALRGRSVSFGSATRSCRRRVPPGRSCLHHALRSRRPRLRTSGIQERSHSPRVCSASVCISLVPSAVRSTSESICRTKGSAR